MIDAEGQLRIDDRTVPLDASQRAQLLAYYRSAEAVHEHGADAGRTGVALAARSIKGAAEQVAGADSTGDDRDVTARSAHVEQIGDRLCADTTAMKAAQDRPGQQLPLFRPYAHLLSEDATDCHNG